MSLKRMIARWKNPHNLTRIHLERLVQTGLATVGDHSYGAPRVRFAEGAKLTIGRFCSFADNVEIFLGGNHRTDFITTYPFSDFAGRWPSAKGLPSVLASRGDVTIGSDVWVGTGVMILSGVHIGHGAVLAAGCVVSRDVLPYTIVAGNPARAVRTRFSPDQVAGLLDTAWWNLGDVQLAPLIPFMTSTDVDAFLAGLRSGQRGN